MSDISLLDIKKVMETSDVDEVNRLLSENWRILATYTYIPYLDTPTSECLIYSLGFPG